MEHADALRRSNHGGAVNPEGLEFELFEARGTRDTAGNGVFVFVAMRRTVNMPEWRVNGCDRRGGPAECGLATMCINLHDEQCHMVSASFSPGRTEMAKLKAADDLGVDRDRSVRGGGS